LEEDLILNTSPVPKYYQLAEILRSQISEGVLNPGDQLPTEDILCQTYNVSRGTVREAVRVLVNDGLIRREQGRGTFVAAPRQPEATFFTLSSFEEDMRRQERQPTSRVLAAEIIPATFEMAERLAIAVDEPVIHIVRLQLADGQPVVHEARFLAQSLCPDLLNDDLEGSSIHLLLIQKHGIPLVRMTHTVEAGSLSQAQSELLQTEPGATAFFVDRLTYTEKNGQKIPAVWYQAIYRGDNYHFRAQSQK
jgi:GntR family transcriptional regulator